MNNYTYVMEGGIDFSGPLKWKLAIQVEGTDGPVIVTGSAQIQHGGDFYFEMMGSPLVEGLAEAGYEGYVPPAPGIDAEMTGGILTGGLSRSRPGYRFTTGGVIYLGNVGTVETGNSIHLDLESTWNSAADFGFEITSSWNIGNPRLHWYRIQGACKPLECPPVAFESDTCHKTIFLVNVLAPNLESVCAQLRTKRFIRRIESIKRFSRPASLTQTLADEAAGIDHSCDVLQEVPFCTIPACLEFCIDHELTIDLGTLNLDRLLNSYESSGGIHLGGAGGTTGFVRDVEAFGGVELDGAAVVVIRSYNNGDDGGEVGGPEIGGLADASTEHWEWITDVSLIDVNGEAAVTSSSFNYGG